MSNELLTEIEEFLAKEKMGEHRFGMLAVNNGRLVERLRAGRSNGLPARVWPETEEQIRTFMSERRARSGEATA